MNGRNIRNSNGKKQRGETGSLRQLALRRNNRNGFSAMDENVNQNAKAGTTGQRQSSMCDGTLTRARADAEHIKR